MKKKTKPVPFTVVIEQDEDGYYVATVATPRPGPSKNWPRASGK